MTDTNAAAKIEITMDTPNGPVVEYGPDDNAETVEREVDVGWRVDWSTPAYRLTSGRLRSPLVHEDVGCECGEVSGEPCDWHGRPEARVTVETPECAARLVADNGDWCSIVER